jgi:murein DD-endopeptidase MepM/ murein hydrolase activator NlpD
MSRSSFVLITAGDRPRSRVHTLSARRLLAAGVLAALSLLAAGGMLGWRLAAGSLGPAAGVAAPTEATAAAHPFALEQIGALSARLFKLESQAAQLGERIGLLPEPTAARPPAVAPDNRRAHRAARASGGSGGPLISPRPLAPIDELGELDRQLERLEGRVDLVADTVALRHSDLMRLPTRRPIAGADLVSPFGNRRDPFTARLAFHAGIDFAAPLGTPILAAAGGLVDVAGWRPDYGWTVEIDHGNGLRTRYAHASKLLVRRGAVIGPGEAIALVGSTGRSTGAHLHYEVLRDGRQVDPRSYLALR